MYSRPGRVFFGLFGLATIMAGVLGGLYIGEISDGIWGDDIFTMFEEHDVVVADLDPNMPGQAVFLVLLGSFFVAKSRARFPV